MKDNIEVIPFHIKKGYARPRFREIKFLFSILKMEKLVKNNNSLLVALISIERFSMLRISM